jgi:pimeloyl-ACP methyl ester carboxylesterase
MNIQLNDVTLHYEVIGNGAAVLFLHGNGEDLHIFDSIAKKMSTSYKVFLLDSRGHGLSEYGNEPLSIHLMAMDVVAFIKTLGLENVTIIGFSDGANIAMEVASAIPHTIDKLVLVGGNTKPMGMKFRYYCGVLLADVKYRIFSFMPSQRKKHQYFKIMLKQDEITSEMLEHITAKTLVMAGEHDMIKPKHTEYIHKSIHNSIRKIIAGGDHFLFHKNEMEISDVIESFLNATS